MIKSLEIMRNWFEDGHHSVTDNVQVIKNVCAWIDEAEREIANNQSIKTCKKLSQTSIAKCFVDHGGYTIEYGYWRCSLCDCHNFEGARYCMNCGALAVDE